MGQGKVVVHVGFLLLHHRYRVDFDVPRALLPQSDNVTQKDTDTPNINCRYGRRAAKSRTVLCRFCKTKVLCNQVLLTLFGLFCCLPDLAWAGGN